MRPRFTFVFAFALLSSLPGLRAAPVDFTPQPFSFVRDGVPFREFKFYQGSQQIEYRPPQDWDCTGTPEAATVRPDKDSSVRAEIRHQEIPNFTPAFDQESLEALRALATALVPPLSQLKLEAEHRAPLLINRHETVDYTFSGVMFAQKYKFYVLLLPMENEEFSFVLYANEKEFDAASKAFLSSIFTFQFN